MNVHLHHYLRHHCPPWLSLHPRPRDHHCAYLGCRTITTFALTFAQLATCNIGLFSLQLHLRLLQGFWLQQPQNVTFSKLSGAIGVVESRNTGSTVLLVLSLTHPNCSTSSDTMSRLKFFQMLA